MKMFLIAALMGSTIAAPAMARTVSAVSVSEDVVPMQSLKGVPGAECRADDAGKGEACTVTLDRNSQIFAGLRACRSYEGEGKWGLTPDGKIISDRVTCTDFDGSNIPAVEAGATNFWARGDQAVYWMGRD